MSQLYSFLFYFIISSKIEDLKLSFVGVLAECTFKLIYLFLVWSQVALLGIDIVSAFVDRMTDRFRGYIGTGKAYPREGAG